jgi:hypothetical protein
MNNKPLPSIETKRPLTRLALAVADALEDSSTPTSLMDGLREVASLLIDELSGGNSAFELRALTFGHALSRKRRSQLILARNKAIYAKGAPMSEATGAPKQGDSMFDSVKNWLPRSDDHQAGARKLEAEAKQFRLPSETLPQVFKYLFFAGLAVLNFRLFTHTVPGAWGVATGIVACMAEAIALYCSHNFSRSAGLFRASLGFCGFARERRWRQRKPAGAP